MQIDFHYYATYCAAFLAGYSHEECMDICYSAQFVDMCTETFLSRIGAPRSATTTQSQLELADASSDLISLQNITRIWSSFHFLPGDLYAQKKGCSKIYLNKYRLICNPNGELLVSTVKRAKDSSLQTVGIAMHILADTWAHRYFAGTPALVINNTDKYFFELIPDGDGFTERRITFKPNPSMQDDPDESIYVNSLYQSNENSIMNLGHGRAGHLPDYSFIRYKYLPAWGDYEEIIKDNPSDYLHAFTQMIEAMKYLRGDREDFAADTYDFDAIAPYREKIEEIIKKRQLDSSRDWKAFGEKLSGCSIEPFNVNKHLKEYNMATQKEIDDTFIGRFIIAALGQKSMVTNAIFKSGNTLAGYSVDYAKKGFKGIADYRKLLKSVKEGSL
jgi:hypothetical protein